MVQGSMDGNVGVNNIPLDKAVLVNVIRQFKICLCRYHFHHSFRKTSL